ncbi:hypothetical protein METBIDRAFT_32429 [Metschnikowia bicuspidata var. bicuspidata NRRL YB-4993]|uniref:Hyphally-regulated cell wall protein N-terminal domain-containing protein n=1 Tax=Metschnikowia bicuspidata var. bicuspidata NRRL YB-4993 TaxID=869754 RepID=A0A1A0H8I1_9ASCO|nr:hypothetical protein METBIDRAFT_32429 [Metschnikowia bicuspidata var. bicuspidata NRRL YB-4993]OBA20424.1 hypothetical protein METBIDRAFT_32429 [Metschnikowia bicuspidata var. bicuspidata NRRL YB-4993]
MTSGFSAVVLTVLCLLSLIFAATITRNTYISPRTEFSTSDITVNANTYYYMLDILDVTVLGSFRNNGQFFLHMSNNRSTSVRMTGNHFENAGVFVFRSFELRTFSDYQVTPSGPFLNTGDMYFGVHNAVYDSLPFSVTSLSSWSNTGMMVFVSEYGEPADLQLQCHDENGIQTSITNNGTIFFTNIHWKARTNIKGNGCMVLGSGVLVDLYYSESMQGIAGNQTIYLADPYSWLRVIGIETREGGAPTLKVAGLGNGNAIIVQAYGSISSVHYSKKNGLLKVYIDDVVRIIFNIGTGYGNFQITGGYISYSEQPPNNPPTICERSSVFPSRRL